MTPLAHKNLPGATAYDLGSVAVKCRDMVTRWDMKRATVG